MPIVEFELAGKVASHSHPAESGTMLTRYFCAACGSPIYGSSPSHPDIVYVRAGSFDDPSVIRPEKQSWMRSRVAWAEVPPTIQSFDKGSSRALDA